MKERDSTKFIRDYIAHCKEAKMLWEKFYELESDPPNVATDSFEYRVWKIQTHSIEGAACEKDEYILQEVQWYPRMLERMGGHEGWVADESSGMSMRYCPSTWEICLKPIHVTCQKPAGLKMLCKECLRKKKARRKARKRARRCR